MKSNLGFNLAALANYGSKSNTPGAVGIREGFIKDAKKFYVQSGCPGKDEIDILDSKTPDISNTMAAIPDAIAGYMAETGRKFNIPATSDTMAPATISIVEVPEKTQTRINQLGPNAGKEYTTTTAPHDEYKVKVDRSAFKK